MPSVYDSISIQGKPRYRRDKKFIAEKNVPPAVLEALTTDNIVDENGLIIVDNKAAEESKLSEADQKKIDEEEKTKSEEGQESATDPENENPGTDPDHDTTVPKTPKRPETAHDDEEDEAPSQPAKKATPPKARRTSEPRFVSKVPQSKPGMGFPRKNGKTVDIFDGETPHTHLKLVGGYTVPLSNESFQNRTEKEIEERLVEMGYELIDYNRNEALDGTRPELDDEGDGLSDDDV